VNVLLIGYHVSAARLLADPTALNGCKVYLLEEPSMFAPDLPYLHLEQQDLNGIVDVRLARYHQSDECYAEAARWHKEVGFHAVVPGREYGVRPAFEIAGLLDLPRPSSEAIDACTDKLLLRDACQTAGISQPAYAEVFGPGDIEDFMKEVNSDVIVKPANRHASLGVVALTDVNRAADAWRHTVEAEGPSAPKDRQVTWRYMVEERLVGGQVSMETLVHSGDVVFNNISDMDFGPGFVELGNTVPAALDTTTEQSLLEANAAFLKAVNADLGLFHSEWRLTAEGPRLIECAARLPGISRPEQIWWAWGYNLALAFAEVLSDRRPTQRPPTRPQRICHIGSLYSEPGMVSELKGIGLLDEIPQIVDYEINAQPGKKLPATQDTWSYALRYTIVEESAQRMQHIKDIVRRSLDVVIRPR